MWLKKQTVRKTRLSGRGSTCKGVSQHGGSRGPEAETAEVQEQTVETETSTCQTRAGFS